jgi:hypothetical protein
MPARQNLRKITSRLRGMAGRPSQALKKLSSLLL